MRLIIAGHRNFDDYQFAATKLDKLLSTIVAQGEVIEIVSGRCGTGSHTFTAPDGTRVFGADGIGEWYANMRGYNVSIFPADWLKDNRNAGPIRNKKMAQYATHCIVFFDGQSKGSTNMIYEAKQAALQLRVISIEIPF